MTEKNKWPIFIYTK